MIQRGFLLLVFVSGYFISSANTLDSLKTALNKAKKTRDIVHLNNLIAREYLFSNPDDALPYCYQATTLAQKNGYKELYAHALNNTGTYYLLKGQYEKSLDYLFKSLSLFEKLRDKNPDVKASYSINIGGVYSRIGTLFQNKADITSSESDLNSAIRYHQLSLKAYTQGNDSLGISYAQNNLGNMYKRQGKYKEALEVFESSLAIKKSMKDYEGMSSTLNNMANVFEAQGNFKKALDFQYQAIDVIKNTASDLDKSISEINIGSLLFTMGRKNEGLLRMEGSIVYAKRYGAKDILIEIYARLAKGYQATGQCDKALEYHTLLTQYKDSVINKENTESIARMQVLFETEKKEKTIALMQKEKERKAAIDQVKQQREAFTRNGLIGGTLFLGLIAFMLYNRSRIKGKANSQLEKSNREITLQKKEVEAQKLLVEEKNREVLDSINYARRVQNAILPSEEEWKKWFPQSFIYYNPKDIVAGDFYFFEHENNHLIFAAADCTGHGVPGALVSVVCHNALNRAVREYNLYKPYEILGKTRSLVMEQFTKGTEQLRDGMDISLVSIEIANSDSKIRNSESEIQLHWSGANNGLWIISSEETLSTQSEYQVMRSESGMRLFEIKPDKQPIGKYALEKPFTGHEIRLKKGDKVYLFTDGYADQFGGDGDRSKGGKKFKPEQLKKLLLRSYAVTPAEQRQTLHDVFEKWRGEFEQIDDVCIIGITL